MKQPGAATTRPTLERWLTTRWYGRGPILWLLPLVPLYVLLAALDRAWQVLFRERLSVPVVVVGNLTVGGTGKTPVVIWLVEQLRAQGRVPGVISRGYGVNGAVRAVSVDAAFSTVGDEPLLIARRTGVPVYIGADRVAAGQALLDAHPEVDVVVSDDGLQHRRLAREAEIVVVDGERGFGNGWRLPAGPLRESLARLATVDAVVVNGAARHGAVTMRLVPGPARRMADGAERPLESFAGATVHAPAGIGNPERFFRMLESRGLVVERHPRDDHAALDPATLPGGEGRPVMLTEKDSVKLPGVVDRQDLWSVPVSAEFEPDAAARLLALIGARLQGVRR